MNPILDFFALYITKTSLVKFLVMSNLHFKRRRIIIYILVIYYDFEYFTNVNISSCLSCAWINEHCIYHTICKISCLLRNEHAAISEFLFDDVLLTMNMLHPTLLELTFSWLFTFYGPAKIRELTCNSVPLLNVGDV